jgi:hypothetical protein
MVQDKVLQLKKGEYKVVPEPSPAPERSPARSPVISSLSPPVPEELYKAYTPPPCGLDERLN